MRWAGNIACMGERRALCMVLVEIHEGNRPTGRTRCRWEDDIKMDLQKFVCGSMNWIDLAQDRDM
jgi:hypothetical protein